MEEKLSFTEQSESKHIFLLKLLGKIWHQKLNPGRRQFKCFINIGARVAKVMI